MKIREAHATDLDRLVEMDAVVQRDGRRIDFIRRSIEQGHCLVCTDNEAILGYGVLDYSFYATGFVALLYVEAQYRRQGAGTHLMQAMESRCETPKLFTSTNLSNLPMQSLLQKLAYQESGIIFNLDPGDPELVYCKALRPHLPSQVEEGNRRNSELLPPGEAKPANKRPAADAAPVADTAEYEKQRLGALPLRTRR